MKKERWKGNTRHNLCNSTEYNAWRSMKGRCYNKNNYKYPNYGGRGITICDRWLESFQNFFDDMGKKLSENHSLDRINVNDNYYKENCRWATAREQILNRTDSLIVTYKGITKHLIHFCEEVGLSYDTVYARLKYRKWPLEKCLEPPLKK